MGKLLAEVATSLGLTTLADGARGHADSKQAYSATCRDAAKATKLALPLIPLTPNPDTPHPNPNP